MHAARCGTQGNAQRNTEALPGLLAAVLRKIRRLEQQSKAKTISSAIFLLTVQGQSSYDRLFLKSCNRVPTVRRCMSGFVSVYSLPLVILSITAIIGDSAPYRAGRPGERESRPLEHGLWRDARRMIGSLAFKYYYC